MKSKQKCVDTYRWNYRKYWPKLLTGIGQSGNRNCPVVQSGFALTVLTVSDLVSFGLFMPLLHWCVVLCGRRLRRNFSNRYPRECPANDAGPTLSTPQAKKPRQNDAAVSAQQSRMESRSRWHLCNPDPSHVAVHASSHHSSSHTINTPPP